MTELEEVEIQIEIAQSMRKLRDSLVALRENKHFKDVIEEGYFKEEAARLVMAKSADLDERFQDRLDGMIIGVGALANYFEMVMRRGAEMDAAIEDHEATREELLAEEVGASGMAETAEVNHGG